MHKKMVPIYVCDYCNEEFNRIWKCRDHEYLKHKCPNCEYSYYSYGCEFNCVRLNDNKKCRYKEKVKNKTI